MQVSNTGFDRDQPTFIRSQKNAGVVVIGLEGVQFSSAFVPIVVTDQSKVDNPFIRDYALVLQAAAALLIAHEGREALMTDPVPLLEQYGLIDSGYRNAVIQSNGQGLSISAVAVRAYLAWKAEQQAQVSA